jgi:hypothetical protein
VVRRATAIAASVVGLTLVGPPANAFAALGLFPVSGGSFNVALDGTDKTPTFTFRVVMSNPSPYNNGGYHLTISAPAFSDGTHTLAPGAVQSVAVSCFSSCAGAPVNSIGFPLTIPTGAPATFFSTAPGTGLGNYNIVPTVTVGVPANTHAGAYTTTITTAFVAGP